MRVVCDRTCQLRIKGKIHTISEGDILTLDVDECPEHFHQLGRIADDTEESIDFENIVDDELKEMEGDVEALKAHLEVNYPEISFAKNIGWAKLVDRYLDARDNRVLKIDHTGKAKNTIVSVKRQLEVEEDNDFAALEAEMEEEKRVKPDSDSDSAFDNIDELLGE